MATYKMEDVFKVSGVPSLTYVKPTEYTRLKIAMRTKGKGVIVEGPSKIGKTSSVKKVIAEIDSEYTAPISNLSARDPQHRETIADLPGQTDLGIVVIDDFHRLDADVRESIADFMKLLADEERDDSKIVVVGINKVGQSLLSLAPDLAGRIDVIRLGVNPNEKVAELVKNGCLALNINVTAIEEIVEASRGSFNLAQMLCFEACVINEVEETRQDELIIDSSFTKIRETVIDQLANSFQKKAELFATGKRLRREGRAPYLQILRWLAMSDEWTIDLDREMAQHPSLRPSVSQVVEKGHLKEHLQKNSSQLDSLLHYDAETRVLAVEDPQFFFFISNLGWAKFSQRLGYLDLDFSTKYDFALSFAGDDRPLAELVARRLQDSEIGVFYDFDEQANILGTDVETYLAPIYRSEATFIVPIMGKEYPNRIWTRFESDQFAVRFGDNRVIPVWVEGGEPGIFDITNKVGGKHIYSSRSLEEQADELVELLVIKIRSFRIADSEEGDTEEILAHVPEIAN